MFMITFPTAPRTWTLLLACLAFLSPMSVIAGEFLVISDIHFNPTAGLDKKQFQKLSSLPASEWPKFLNSLEQPVSQPGSDSNFSLMNATLNAAQQRLADPQFILYPGDLLSHEWQAKYNQLAARNLHEDPTAYREFTRKALTVVANAFKEQFPDTMVYATLGNDDSFCQDYWIQPNGDFLSTFFNAWKPLLGELGNDAIAQKSIQSLGVYSVDLPGSKSNRLIVLNSVFWSASYCCDYFSPKAMNCCDCVNQGDEPGKQQFAWLERELSIAQQQNKHVWLLMHVPPGLDSYAEEKANGASRAAELWTKEFTTRYLKLVSDYRDTLAVSFAGHTHMDDFRVDRIRGIPVLLHKISPGVSPIFGNNPAFQIYQQATSGKILNWQTHFTDLKNGSSKRRAAAWKLEYDARATYGITEVNAQSMTQVFAAMKSNPTGPEANAYRRYYRVQATPIAFKDLFIYACAVLNATFDDYHRCVTSQGLLPPKQDPEPARLRESAGGG